MLEQIHGIRLRVKFCVDRFIMWPSGGENPQILPFFGLRHFVLSPFGGILTKFNTDAQLQTFLNPAVSKSFPYSNAFMAKSGAQAVTFKSLADNQTDKKTQRFRPPRPAPPNLAR